ncbi:transcriptional activator RfaH [Pseudomonas veronii]|uniref:transcriptional activator RfaH n=1 Tax=Pseudomonas veronii TaxID=76761 RepID=UPI0009E5F9FD|nr:transcriptional activator RfaH [Pseudomonas veronii]
MNDTKYESKWYLVHCKSKQDRVAEQNLTRQGFSCFRATCSASINNKNISYSGDSLFPGYIFIRLTLDTSWAPIKSTKGVLRIVSFGKKPLSIKADIIDSLKARSEDSSLVEFARITSEIDFTLYKKINDICQYESEEKRTACFMRLVTNEG